MTWDVHRKTRIRFETSAHARFLTFSTKHRQPFFNDPALRDQFADHLAFTRNRLGFKLHAWVIMPEHIHLLVRLHTSDRTVPTLLMALKRPFSAHVLKLWREQGKPTPPHFWQPGGGHDRNIFTPDELQEKYRYIHNNPVTRGLVEHPINWAWSSARAQSNLETPWPQIDRC